MLRKYDLLLKLIIPLSYFPVIMFIAPSFTHNFYIMGLLVAPDDYVYFYRLTIIPFLFIFFAKMLLLFRKTGKSAIIYYVVLIDLIVDLIVCFYSIFFRNLQYDRIDYQHFAILFVFCLLFVVQAFLKPNNVKFVFVTFMVTAYAVYYFTCKYFDSLELPGCSYSNYIMRDLLTLLLLVLRKKEIKKQQAADLVRFSVIPDGYAPECKVIPPCCLSFDVPPITKEASNNPLSGYNNANTW